MLKIEKLDKISRARYARIINRSQEKIFSLVSQAGPVIEDIRKNGNRALTKYIKKYENITIKPSQLIVKEKEIEQAYRNLPPGLRRDIQLMVKNVKVFYKKQLANTNKGWQFSAGGRTLGQVVRPLESVGVYVPGGTAAYPSTAVMGIVPAKIAGVKNIVLATPSGQGKIRDIVLVAADLAGADIILKAGGMHAVGALAVGTENVPAVDRIVGPGNIWVSAAKLYVMIKNYASIEFVAGPSEVLIIADSSADSSFIARDMMAQAEHDRNSSVVLVTSSAVMAKQVIGRLKDMVKCSPRRKTIEASLAGYGAVLVVSSLKQAVEFANSYAPEHLQVMAGKPEKILKSIKNAGSIFLGNYTPTALGDYVSGTNHILPTGGGGKV